MSKGKATKADYSKNNNGDEFCRFTLTVEVEANQVLVLGIKAKWFLINWEERGWSESKRYRFKNAGNYNINLIGERILWLNVDGCGVTFIHFDSCDFLTRLRCQGNKLKGLNLENCPALTFIDCSRNKLEYVQVVNLKRLKEFKGYENKLQVMDFSGCSELQEVDLSYNEVMIIVTRKCRKLKYLLFNGALFEVKRYKKAAGDFPGVIINEKGFLNIIEDKRLSSITGRLNEYIT